MRYPKIRSKMTISLKTNQGFPTLNSMDRPMELQEPGLYAYWFQPSQRAFMGSDLGLRKERLNKPPGGRFSKFPFLVHEALGPI